jgi:hypothetical protein
MRLLRIGVAAILLAGVISIFYCPTAQGPAYERIVIETYKYKSDTANVDTYLRLYDAAGTLLAENDNITASDLFSRIDYTAGLEPGTYYIEINSETTPFPSLGPYVVRVLSLKLGEALPAYDYPGVIASEPWPDGDDSAPLPSTPKDISLGTDKWLNRYLTTLPDHVGEPYDVDWCVLVLP